MIVKSGKQKRNFMVRLPEGVDISGYNSIDLNGETSAYSRRQAVSHHIARQNEDIVGLVISELDNNFWGAEHYAFEPNESVEIPTVFQTDKDLENGEALTPRDYKVLIEHALAYELMRKNNADTSNSKLRSFYLDRARIILRNK